LGSAACARSSPAMPAATVAATDLAARDLKKDRRSMLIDSAACRAYRRPQVEGKQPEPPHIAGSDKIPGMTYKNVLFEVSAEGVARITVNRPEKRNALNIETMNELEDAFVQCERDTAIRAAILTGAGDKAFVAGADINELVDATPLEAKARCLRDQGIVRRLETMGKPTVAAINGYALGGGLELAMACSMRVAAATAKLGLPEIRIGIFPGNGGTQRLPRLIGSGKALEMLLTGEPISAGQAERAGLVNHVVAPEELLPFCENLLHRILSNAPVAARLILECVDVGLRCGLEEGLRFEAAVFASVAASEDRREGTTAFLEKRKPAFQGR
jgi:enoyl-CoA hydratase/carnithine racemase